MKPVIGIMWPGETASAGDIENAYQIGKFCAELGWTVLTGGRNSGVMDAGLRGAKSAGGLTVAILPNDDPGDRSEWIDVPIVTNMRSGRNAINALSSDIMVAYGMNLWTSSEVSLALRAGKPVILVGVSNDTVAFYSQFTTENLHVARSSVAAQGVLRGIFADLSQ